MDENPGADFRTLWDNSTKEPNPEGFGTWPFGEEWLWEAIGDQLPAAAEGARRARSRGDRGQFTLSLTPVLCDQLEAPGAIERCVEFLREIRPESHGLDIEAFGQAGETGGGRGARAVGGGVRAAADTLDAATHTRGGLLGGAR